MIAEALSPVLHGVLMTQMFCVGALALIRGIETYRCHPRWMSWVHLFGGITCVGAGARFALTWP